MLMAELSVQALVFWLVPMIVALAMLGALSEWLRSQ